MQAKDLPRVHRNVPLSTNGANLRWMSLASGYRSAGKPVKGLSVEAGVLFDYGEWNGMLFQDLSDYWNSPDIEGYR